MVSSLGAMPLLSGPVFEALFSVLDFNQFSQYGRSSTKKAHTLWITRSERAKNCTAHRLISGYFESVESQQGRITHPHIEELGPGAFFFFSFFLLPVFTCPNWPNYNVPCKMMWWHGSCSALTSNKWHKRPGNMTIRYSSVWKKNVV